MLNSSDGKPVTVAFVYRWERWLDGPDLNDPDYARRESWCGGGHSPVTQRCPLTDADIPGLDDGLAIML
ncbi:MAG: hypothetical protein KAY37_09475 [Phycisphaerae bacterium]|nr:hypothetical protein [Phycisphaerae bacterium]